MHAIATSLLNLTNKNSNNETINYKKDLSESMKKLEVYRESHVLTKENRDVDCVKKISMKIRRQY